MLNMSSISRDNERQSFAKLSNSAIDMSWPKKTWKLEQSGLFCATLYNHQKMLKYHSFCKLQYAYNTNVVMFFCFTDRFKVEQRIDRSRIHLVV